MTLKGMWSSIKNGWAWFEAKVAAVTPGIKTKLISALGFVGSSAAMMQQYLTGIPTNKFVTGEQMAIIGVVLFTLVFWLKDIGTRVAAREA